MSDKIYYSGYYGTTEASGSWFSSCCGARYVKKPSKANMTNSYRGIRVAVGAVHEPYVGPKQCVDVVQTKNGPLTIGVRHAW